MSVTTELPALISTSALSVAFIQWVKNSQLPILSAFSQQSAGLNRTLSWLVAMVTGIGIHWHYDPALGALTITGLTLAAVTSAAINTAKSYGFNWFIYNVSGVKQRSSDAAAVGRTGTGGGGIPATTIVPAGTAKTAEDQTKAEEKVKAGE